MAASSNLDFGTRDPAIDCRHCAAVCCRLTVLLAPGDSIPAHLIDIDERGLETMAKGEDGWCAAIDPLHLRCGIYARRPAICREFEMGGGACREERAAWYSKSGADFPA